MQTIFNVKMNTDDILSNSEWIIYISVELNQSACITRIYLHTSDGTSRDPFSYRRERVDETLSRPDEICLLNKKRDTITEAICGHYRVVITYMCVI